MSKPFFSVVIPTYNRFELLKRSIDSVVNQSFKDFELIIIDDGSSDETLKYLESQGLNFLTVSEKNKPEGVSRARNIGVDKTKADWICFLDSDDVWMPLKLEEQYKFIENFPELKINYTQERWIRNGIRVNQPKNHKKGGGDQFEASLDGCIIGPSTVCLRRDLLMSWDGFREDYVVCEDYDLWLKISTNEEIGFIDTELIEKYGGHEDQLSRRYVAMDYYRVKSIKWVLDHIDLNEHKQIRAKEVLIKKAEILLKGYKKHDNLDNYDEIRYILDSIVGV